MFVVRSGGTWDDPPIEFITSNEEIAKQVILTHQRSRYKWDKESSTRWTKSQKAKYNLAKMLASAPETKKILGEEEYKYLLEEIEKDTTSWEHSEKAMNETFEEYSERSHGDWYYEEIEVIDSLEEALKLDSITNRYGSRPVREKKWG